MADTTMQTAVHGAFLLLSFSILFGKKGGHLLGNVTSLCLHGLPVSRLTVKGAG